ncbi:T9SS type A sorting domain-containing protein, partial [Candidatus Poribacteria bacterium]|nr:T9SS type A sorting domain-containing protein [Candidatus Poribacteria bacterium]
TYIYLYLVVNGVNTQLGYFNTWDASFSAKWHELKVERDGCIITVFVDGVGKIGAFDTTFTGGKVGLMGYCSRFDDFNYSANSAPVAEVSSDNWDIISGNWFLTDRGGGDMAINQGPVAGLDALKPILLSKNVDNMPSVFSLSTQLRILDDWSATGLVFNYQNQDNYYFAYISWTYIYLYLVVNGVNTQLGYFNTWDASFSAKWHELKVERDGCIITVFVDGVGKIGAFDTTFTGGKVGLMGYCSRFDNFNYFANSAPVVVFSSPDWDITGKWLLTDKGGGNMAVDQATVAGESLPTRFLLSNTVDSASSNFSLSVYTIVFSYWGPAGLVFNYEDEGNYYYSYIAHDRVYLYRVLNGNTTQLFDAWTNSFCFANRWNNLNVVRADSWIRVFVNGVKWIECNDGSIMNGKVGLFTMGTCSCRFDDFNYTDASKNIMDNFGQGVPVEFGTSDDFGQGIPVAQNASDEFGDGIPIVQSVFDNFGQAPHCVHFIADAGGPYVGEEGSPIILNASNSINPDGVSLQYRWDFNNDGTWDTGWLDSPTTSYVWYDDWQGTARVEISDGRITSTDTADVTVNNVAPTAGTITAQLEPVMVNNTISASASFTDPGTLDTHTAIWNWGDGNTSDGAVTESNGSGSVTGNHAYNTAGVYTVTLTVTDEDGGSGESTFKYIVVYDPSAGFVTGGGWINSPPGAYVAEPSLVGKANFGFVSKYQKGAKVPTGQTEFQFKVANLNFHSTVYEWLVIAGAKAQYKGTGTINNSGNYGFMLTAIDGQIKNGGGGVDKFRIKIWDKNNGDSIVYDNQMDAGDDAEPTTVIGGGSIVIHKDDKPAAPSSLPSITCLLASFPNPGNPEVWIPYQLGSDSEVVIRIYDLAGRLVRTVDLGYQTAGFYNSRSKSAYWDGNNQSGERVASGIYFYTIQAGDYTATKKMVITR